MTRREALFAVTACAALVVAGVVWLFGPYGLIGSGLVFGGLLLTVVNEVKEPAGAEAVADAVPQPDGGRGVPLQPSGVPR